MRSRWFHAPTLHSGHGPIEKKVSWLELFYDLIFVAAFIQLGNGLAERLDARGTEAFAGAFLALWVIWTGFSFFENRYTVGDFLHRTMTLAQMFSVAAVGLFAGRMIAGETEAFSISVASGLFLVSLMYLRALVQMKTGRDYSKYWGAVFGGSAVLWALASQLDAPGCYYLWGAATVLVLLAPFMRASRQLAERYPLDWEHLSERYGLLTIIVLGESFVKVLSMLVQEQAGWELLLSGTIALVLTCGVWWIYFDDIAGARIRTERGQWIVWLYSHIFLHIGIVALAVGIKKAVLFSWDAPAPPAYRFLLAGSLALVFFAVAAIDSVTERRNAELSDRARINARWLSGVVLLVLGAAGRAMSGMSFLVLVCVINVAQVIFDMMMAPLEESDEVESVAVLGATTFDVAGGGSRQIRPTRVGDVSRAIRKGAPASVGADLYAYFLRGSWGRVFVGFGFLFFVSNLFFAALYVLEPGGVSASGADNLLNAFFFSVQTMATIGYGAMSPATPYSNAVVVVEAIVSMVGIAIVTGLIFARASRPQSSILFSKVATISRYHDKTTLMLRMGNARGNEIVDASVKVMVLKDTLSPEGTHMRRFFDLQLERSTNPFFSLGWTVIHVIDDSSPLADVDPFDIEGTMGSLSVSVVGHDGTYGATTYARHLYQPEDIRVGHRFVDTMSRLEDGRIMIDYTKFHDTVALEEG